MKRLIVLALITLSYNAQCQFDNIGSGHAISFDGIDDVIELGDIYDNIQLPVSVSAWIKVDPDKTSVAPIFVSQDNFSLYNGFWVVISPSRLVVGYGDGLGYNNSAYRRERSADHPDVFGKWVNVCAVIKGATDMDLYVNGINRGGTYSGSSNLPMASNYPNEIAKIGRFLTNDVLHKYKGEMDELKVWKKALTEAEVREQMCKKLTGNEPGLMGYWDFNETSGLTLFDKSPNAFHGQLIGNPERVFSGAPIGDESVFQYTSSWSEFQMEDLTVKNIQGGPRGIHIYKVNGAPSRTSGLNMDHLNASYYGVFAVNDGMNTVFDIDLACQAYLRTDNSVAVWESKSPVGVLNRTEIIQQLDQSTPLSIDLGKDLEFCEQNSHVLKTNVDAQGKSFLWSTGETTPEITVITTGKYKVSVMEGCSVETDSVTISFLPSPSIDLELGDDVFACNTDSYRLATNLSSEGKSFIWSTGETTPEIVITNSGEYHVKVSEGCSSIEDAVFVTIITNVERMIPNIITPNGDPLNQYFILENLSDGRVGLEVFNRWGKVVYTAMNYGNNWDGGDLTPGVYFYRVKDECGKIYKGTLTICR